MPRKPTNHRRSLLARPLTFSPFARSVAHMASAYIIKNRTINKSHFHKPDFTSKDDNNGLSEPGSEQKSEGSESSDGEEFEGTIQADFAFFDPKPDDFHGVKMLLKTYLDSKQWDLSGFVDLILGQTTVGTMVKIEDNEDAGIFAVVSALNLGRHKSRQCINEIKEFLLKECRETNVLDDLRLLLEERSDYVGLLVYQHVVNLPPQLLPPLYDGLFDEVSWAIEDEPTEELRNSFRLKSYLLISRIYKHKNADHKKWKGGDENEAIIYIKPEDEIFHKLCSWSFYFPLHTEQVTAHELRNYQLTGLVMAIEAEKVPTFRKELHSLIDDTS